MKIYNRVVSTATHRGSSIALHHLRDKVGAESLRSPPVATEAPLDVWFCRPSYILASIPYDNLGHNWPMEFLDTLLPRVKGFMNLPSTSGEIEGALR